jgi:hypothetical protein
LGFLFGNLEKKCHLDVALQRVTKEGGEWCLLPKVTNHIKLVLEAMPTKSATPFAFNLH